IDWNAGQVVIQTATTKTEGGVTSTTGECSDSASTYAIQRSYARCPSDEIDRETMKAYPTYISYWTDGEGSNHDLTNCIADTDQFFDITTTSDGCTVEVDLENNVARQRAREVYINANNTQIEVSRCSVTGDQSYPITFTTNGCSIRHDYMEGVSAELHRAFYVKDGQEQTALGCAESGRTFAHETLRFLDGIAVCSWLEDPITQAAYPQERTRIDVDGSQEWITECAPIEDAASPFQVTTDGCEFTYFHDIGASVSYGSQKTYYVADEDKRVYLSDCRQSEATYDHHLEGGSVHGWIYNDEARTAKERSAIYIETPWGRREVAPASILPDTPDVPYAYVKTANAQTGESIYEGCEGWYVTALTEQWKRPDNTSYFLPIGPGDPAGPRNVCDVVETNKWIVVGLQYGRVSNSAWTCHGEHSNGDPKGWHKDWLHYVQRYGTRIDRTNFETGEFLGTDYSWGGETNNGYAIAPTCTGAGSYWLQTEYIGRTWFYNGYGWRKIYLSTLPKDW
ncbi:MAG: hypothetical protein MI741_21745, partial [Rhodospirillales bacterium]|nr:hypothetical protein [Rhodospirillales bacterium]